ncbi:MAG: TetR/AcrR family transcriptional regulator [Alkalibacterium sp.]|nr:TetR/AcrR family transcriptional regulator [Alkalibacterium sp.]
MDDAFKALDSDKQRRILDSAYKEFSNKGYKQASTNRIAKEAGIGKGTLFYYFTNKEGLFHDLVEEAFCIADEFFLKKVDFSETDFFIRLRQTSELKWAVYQEHPHALSFMARVFIHSDEHNLPDKLLLKRTKAEHVWGSLLTKNIDFSKFRDDIPQETSFNFIRWTIEGYRTELEQRVKMEGIEVFTNQAFEPYYKEFYSYLDTLKKIYYKPEYTNG